MKIVLFDHSITYSFNPSFIHCVLFRMAHRNGLICFDSLLCHVSDCTLCLFFQNTAGLQLPKNSNNTLLSTLFGNAASALHKEVVWAVSQPCFGLYQLASNQLALHSIPGASLIGILKKSKKEGVVIT